MYWEANQTQHSFGHGDEDSMNSANDRRRFPGNSFDSYFGTSQWFQFSLNYGSGMVEIDLTCYDTTHPTLTPSVSPTTPAPTLAPTEGCYSVFVKISSSGVTEYNGVYNRQASTINGHDWWVARNDVGATQAGTNATIYFSQSNDRWVLEAPDR